MIAFFVLIQLCTPPGIHIGQCMTGTSSYVYLSKIKCEKAAKREAVKQTDNGYMVISTECRAIIFEGQSI